MAVLKKDIMPVSYTHLKFSDEYTVLIDTTMDALAKVVDASIAQAIVKVRSGTAKVTPGYDGVYGQLVLGVDTLSLIHI